MNIGLVGLGYWGKNLLRNIAANSSTENIYVCDVNPTKISFVESLYRLKTTYLSIEDMLGNSTVQCVVVATPTGTHYEIAKQVLCAGKHVLIEKPMTTSGEQAKELIELAQNRGLVLMVDHVYLYHPAVVKLKNCIRGAHINYIDSTRINLGIYQEDVNVLWDLACHDISIINYLIEERPISVRAIGRINPIHGFEDLAYLFLHYSSGLLVQVNASWSSPVKIRKMIIGAETQMFIFDDIERANRLTIYDYEANIKQDDNKNQLTDYRLGDVTLPKYEPEEALKNVIDSFYSSIKSGMPPLADGTNALSVIEILEYAQKSLKLGGHLIPTN